jgi:hypothetical protein
MTSGSAVPPDGSAWPARQPAGTKRKPLDHADADAAGPSRQRPADHGWPQGAEPVTQLSSERAHCTEGDGADDEYEPL